MKQSPYYKKPKSKWKDITQKLIKDYPISTNEILEISILVWDKLWSTKVGNTIELNKVELPATVVGYFFQKLFTYELSMCYKGKWRGEENKNDKDLMYCDNQFSTEMKSSGQMKYEIFGNRSYNQNSQRNQNILKDKSSYYITINFSGKILTLIRLGWIDQDDWIPQNAQNGQAATLKKEVYEYKLQKITGAYQLKSPIELLDSVGKTTACMLKSKNIFSFEDIINYHGNDKQILKIKNKNKEILTPLSLFNPPSKKSSWT